MAPQSRHCTEQLAYACSRMRAPSPSPIHGFAWMRAPPHANYALLPGTRTCQRRPRPRSIFTWASLNDLPFDAPPKVPRKSDSPGKPATSACAPFPKSRGPDNRPTPSSGAEPRSKEGAPGSIRRAHALGIRTTQRWRLPPTAACLAQSEGQANPKDPDYVPIELALRSAATSVSPNLATLIMH